MSAILNGRMTARLDEPFVVFLIGMRFNKPWKLHKIAPVLMAMPRMIAELSRQPEMGFLGADSWFGRTILMVQYWRSFEQLEAYAKSREHAHLPAWAAFNRAGVVRHPVVDVVNVEDRRIKRVAHPRQARRGPRQCAQSLVGCRGREPAVDGVDHKRRSQHKTRCTGR